MWVTSELGFLMEHYRVLIGIIVVLVIGAGCSPSKTSARGFRLPDGDPKTGEIVYVDLGCNQCHSIPQLEILNDALGDSIEVALGGERTRVLTYGELVTSIINPSHRIARGYPLGDVTRGDGMSRMRNYNEIMSVQELVDLVAFLQPLYKVTLPQYQYPHYVYP
jgi:sulfur-oxidizing protein SoxX